MSKSGTIKLPGECFQGQSVIAFSGMIWRLRKIAMRRGRTGKPGLAGGLPREPAIRSPNQRDTAYVG